MLIGLINGANVPAQFVDHFIALRNKVREAIGEELLANGKGLPQRNPRLGEEAPTA